MALSSLRGWKASNYIFVAKRSARLVGEILEESEV